MPKVKLLDPTDERRRLDRYELIGELAAGGMATVFLGRIAGAGGFQRFVAIKRLHPHLAHDQEFIEMFLDEARLAARIHHPHVVPILEVGETASGYYLVMEYIEGDTLSRVVARALSQGKGLSPPILIRILLDALSGLHAAHELMGDDGQLLNLVHRDCSPQNVLVGVDGCSRITDFGVARASSRLSSTRGDRLKGKLSYMSPEQARGDDLDRRSDVFAMGIVLWEILTGKRLFKAENEAAILTKVLTGPIPAPSRITQGIHPAIDAACLRALDRDLDRRYQSAAEFADALEVAGRQAATATEVGVASPRDVAGYMQSMLGTDIAAQRESVRAWLSASDVSLPRVSLTPVYGSGPSTKASGTMPMVTAVMTTSHNRDGDPSKGSPNPSGAFNVAQAPTMLEGRRTSSSQNMLAVNALNNGGYGAGQAGPATMPLDPMMGGAAPGQSGEEESRTALSPGPGGQRGDERTPLVSTELVKAPPPNKARGLVVFAVLGVLLLAGGVFVGWKMGPGRAPASDNPPPRGSIALSSNVPSAAISAPPPASVASSQPSPSASSPRDDGSSPPSKQPRVVVRQAPSPAPAPAPKPDGKTPPPKGEEVVNPYR